jgi:hypothetical protein
VTRLLETPHLALSLEAMLREAVARCAKQPEKFVERE